MIKLITGGVFTFLVIVIMFSTAAQIEETERGVLTQFGEVKEVLDPGFHLINPFTQTVHYMDTSVQALPVDGQAYSKDAQIVDFAIIVNFQQNAEAVEQIYSEVQRDATNRYVIPRANDAIRKILAQYTAQEILDNRGIIPGEVRERLTGELVEDGISVESVSITNFDFDDAYERAVTNKQVQEQEALTQANITAQEEEKKQQAILQAEAVAEKTRLEVQALSLGGDDIIRKIQAEAQLEAARKWNGQLPVNMYGSAPIPLIDVNQMQ